eukprot:TRINITY_DN4800_c0_g2_i1.p1 TRINITY_DN4800_c0_g2~~TRINITY_DN4800_c0_g2_i1.p1  ORF type:complete len:238 (-),score=10.69 TRINITY_DN4800_c0_g2_i1:542-1192(-)
MVSVARRLRDLTSKYGKVAVGVHIAVSALCFTGFYVAIRSSLDVESVLERVGLVLGHKEEQIAVIEGKVQTIDNSILRDPAAVERGRSDFSLRTLTGGSNSNSGSRTVVGSIQGSSIPASSSVQTNASEANAALPPVVDSQTAAEEVLATEPGVIEVHLPPRLSRFEQLQKAALGGGGSLALAFVCNKAILPIRVPLTFLLTPPVHRTLLKWGLKV